VTGMSIPWLWEAATPSTRKADRASRSISGHPATHGAASRLGHVPQGGTPSRTARRPAAPVLSHPCFGRSRLRMEIAGASTRQRQVERASDARLDEPGKASTPCFAAVVALGPSSPSGPSRPLRRFRRIAHAGRGAVSADASPWSARARARRPP
jgi:hypothetical protein